MTLFSLCTPWRIIREWRYTAIHC